MFLDKAEHGIQKVEGHYEIQLPFHHPDVNMSNNRESHLAEEENITRREIPS